MEITRPKGLLNGFTIKIIAMISMLTDHTAAVFVNAEQHAYLYEFLRGAGRIAFPVFCFMLVEGFMHTGDVKKYLLRLFIFAVISEIPFDLAFFACPGTYFDHQNVFFTLALGLLTLCCIRQFENDPYMNIVSIVIACIIAYLLKFDYSYFGILQIMIFYYLRQSGLYKIFSIAVLNIIMGQPAGALALIFTEAYNGRRGPDVKYVMYIFYPAHLLVIYFARTIIQGLL